MRRASRTRLALWICVVLPVTAGIIVSSRQIGTGITTAARSIYEPVHAGTLDVIQPIGRIFSNGANYGSLKIQNEKLQAAIGQLKLQREESAFERIQLYDLQALQHLSFTMAPTVLAETIDSNSQDFTSTITIDKGSSSGVDYGMPVVTGAGLVGQVTEVANSTAVVRLINDGSSRVGVVLSSPTSCSGQTPCSGLVAGQGPRTDDLLVNTVPPRTRVRKGEILKTISLSGAEFPGGIPAAKVTTAQTAVGAAQETVVATPMVDFSQPLPYVAVLQWEPSPTNS